MLHVDNVKQHIFKLNSLLSMSTWLNTRCCRYMFIIVLVTYVMAVVEAKFEICFHF